MIKTANCRDIPFSIRSSKLKSYQHLFFDFDRTLWDFDANTLESFRDLCEKHGLAGRRISNDIFYEVYHKHNTKLWDKYREGKITKQELRATRFYITLLDFGVDDRSLALRMDSDYLEISAQKSLLFPYTHEALEYLYKKYKLYILTNGFREVQETKVRKCGLEKYFVRVFTSEEKGILKPQPAIFEWVISTVNAQKDTCLMIGDDMEVDIKGAKNAGIDQVWFNPDGIKRHFKPTYEIKSLMELTEIF
jgi:putative hydrolase of the HAD superfamily